MGFLDMFRKKPKIELQIDVLYDWLDNYVQRQDITTQIAIIKREVKAKYVKLEEFLQELEKAELKDESVVPERAQHIMEGNREAYIKKIRLFMNETTIPEDYNDVRNYLEEMSKKLEVLGQNTTKNFYILKEFFQGQVTSIASKLAELDKLLSSAIERLDKTALNKIEEIKKLTNEYYEQKTELQILRKKLEEQEQEKIGLFDRKNKIDEKIKKIKETPHYQEFQELKQKKEDSKEKLKSEEQKITRIFSDIDAALKKGAKQKANNLLAKYQKNPVNALLEDKDIQIIKELEKISKKIDDLDLKDAKRKKTIDTINKISKEKLEKSKNTIQKLTEDIEGLTKRIQNHASRLNLKEQQGFIETINESIEEQNKKSEETENQIERINPNLKKQKIRQIIKELDDNVELK